MEPAHLLAYALTAFLGLTMGLIGAGGSIVIVPVMVYLLQVPAERATGQSLFVVGSVSLFGMLLAARKSEVALGTAALFIAASLPMAYVGRGYLLPALPESFAFGGYALDRSALLMLLFALTMSLAARSMLVSKAVEVNASPPAWVILPLAAVVGLVTGFLGAGGGFVIVPALALAARMPMKQAVGTSLAIIAANSAAGFGAEMGHGTPPWPLLLPLALTAMTGMAVGTALRSRFDGQYLRRLFGWFVLSVAALILIEEIWRLVYPEAR